MRRRLRAVVGAPAGRAALVALPLAAAWAAWAWLPPRPLSHWRLETWEPYRWQLSPDRRLVAWATRRPVTYPQENGPVRVVELATGQERLSVPPGPSRFDPADQAANPVDLAFAPDGAWLLTAQYHSRSDRRLEVWDIGTARQRMAVTVRGNIHSPGFVPAVVSLDGRSLAGCVCDPSPGIIVWDTRSGDVRRERVHVRPPLAFSADGRALAVGTTFSPNGIRLIDVASGWSEAVPASAEIEYLAFSPDGRRLAGWQSIWRGDGEYTIRVWRLPERTVEVDLTTPRTSATLYHGLAFSPDGSLLTARARSGTCLIWDLRRSPPALVTAPTPPVPNPTSFIRPEVFRHYPIFSPDGSRFLVAGPESWTLELRSTADPARPLSGWDIRGLACDPDFSPDGSAVAWVTAEARLEQWQEWVNWLAGRIGRPAPYALVAAARVHIADARTGVRRGEVRGLPEGSQFLGFAAGGDAVWTFAYAPVIREEHQPGSTRWVSDGGPLDIRSWAVPTGRPPAWLLGLTALVVPALAADWWRGRARRRRAGLSAAVAVGYPAAQGGPLP